MDVRKGALVSTPGALDTYGSEFIGRCLDRHNKGDWGELPEEDREMNDKDQNVEGSRVLSVYHKKQEGEDKLWIITEAINTEHQVTTVLLPSEY